MTIRRLWLRHRVSIELAGILLIKVWFGSLCRCADDVWLPASSLLLPYTHRSFMVGVAHPLAGCSWSCRCCRSIGALGRCKLGINSNRVFCALTHTHSPRWTTHNENSWGCFCSRKWASAISYNFNCNKNTSHNWSQPPGRICRL